MNYSVVLQSLIPLFLIISFMSINFELSLCAIDPQYSECSQNISCGVSTGISYPFWGVNRPDYCGEPGFEVKCQNNIPVIISIDVELRILGMTSETVKVARQDYWRTICPESLVNTTLNHSLFYYPTSGIRNVTFYYGCNSTPPEVLSNRLICIISNRITPVGYSTKPISLDSYITNCCKNEVIVPVLESAAVKLEADFISIGETIEGGFELELKIDNDQCYSCKRSGGRCGVNTTNGGGFLCFCQDQPYTATCNLPLATSSSGTSSSGARPGIAFIGIGIWAGVSGIIILAGIIRISWTRKVFFKKYRRNEFDVEAVIRNYGSLTPKRYSYSNVKKITNSFKEKIGRGGYGIVYKGELAEGLVVAVKVLIEPKGNGEEFINEVASIGRTSHVNVVTLLGFCYEKDKRALIYEYMPNGSLDNFTPNYGSSTENCQLQWKILLEIAVGIARGLEYLHRGCNTRILHLDIKPQNILLDEDLCPKISDFGLAKLCMTKESIVSMLGTRGTAGYIAPEVFSRNFGGVSHKSDVYSYGMLLLEMVGARKNLDSGVSHTSEMFPHYVYKDLELEQDENNFGAISPEEKEIARKMILISLWCIQTVPSDRPSMSKVVEMLEAPLYTLQIAPKPVLFSSTIFAAESVTTSQPSDTS